MSVAVTLQRIERWATDHYPEFVALLQPPLTRVGIEEHVAGLPFSLAEEVYELYLWHDGQRLGEFRFGLFQDGCSYPFLPLAGAVSEYDRSQADRFQWEIENGNLAFAETGGWLPLFGMESDFLATSGTERWDGTAPLLQISREDMALQAYPSLAAALTFRADLYESGAMRYDAEMGGYADYRIACEILRRHFTEKAASAEDAYDRLYGSDRELLTAKYAAKEWQDMAVVADLVGSGSVRAVPAAQEYLGRVRGGEEQARRLVQEMLQNPWAVARDWPYTRQKFVCGIAYSFLIG